VADCLIFCSAV